MMKLIVLFHALLRFAALRLSFIATLKKTEQLKTLALVVD